MDWETLDIQFTLTATFYQDTEEDVLNIEQWTSSDKEDGITIYYDLDILLDKYRPVDGELELALVAVATITDDNGDTLTDTINYSASYQLESELVSSSIEVTSVTRESHRIDQEETQRAFSAVGGSLNPLENPLIIVLLFGFLLAVFGIYTSRRS